MAAFKIFTSIYEEIQDKMNKLPKNIRSEKLEEWESGKFHMYFTGSGWIQHYNNAQLFTSKIKLFNSTRLKECFRGLFALGLKELQSDLKEQLDIVLFIWQSEVLFESWLRRVFNFFLKGEHKAIRINRKTYNKFVKKFNYDPNQIKKGTALSLALEDAMKAGAKEAKDLTFHLLKHGVGKSDVLLAAQKRAPKVVSSVKLAKKKRRAARVAARVDEYVESSVGEQVLHTLKDIATSPEAKMLANFMMDIDHMMLRYKHIESPRTLMLFIAAVIHRSQNYWGIKILPEQLKRLTSLLYTELERLVSNYGVSDDVDVDWVKVQREIKYFNESLHIPIEEAKRAMYHLMPDKIWTKFDNQVEWRSYKDHPIADASIAKIAEIHYNRRHPIGELLNYSIDGRIREKYSSLATSVYIPSGLEELWSKFKIVMKDSQFSDELHRFVTSSALTTLAFSLSGAFDATPQLKQFIRNVGAMSAGATTLMTITKIVDMFIEEVIPYLRGEQDLQKNVVAISSDLMAALPALLRSYTVEHRWKFVEQYTNYYGITITDREELALIEMERLIYQNLKAYVELNTSKFPDTLVLAQKNLLGCWLFELGKRVTTTGSRPQTMNVLIHGKAGAGKSYLANLIDAVLAVVYDVPFEDDGKGGLKRKSAAIIVDSGDNYPLDHLSEYDYGLWFDDIGTSLPEKEKQTVFITFMITCAGIRAHYAKSDVSQKGKVVINNRYSILTSNFRDCNVKGRISNPEAFLRRINVAVEPIVCKMCVVCEKQVEICNCKESAPIFYYDSFMVEYQNYPSNDHRRQNYLPNTLLEKSANCKHCATKDHACMLCRSFDVRKRLLEDIKTFAIGYRDYQIEHMSKTNREIELCPCGQIYAICGCDIFGGKPTQPMNIFGFTQVLPLSIGSLVEDTLSIILPPQLAYAFYLVRWLYEGSRALRLGHYTKETLGAQFILLWLSCLSTTIAPLLLILMPLHWIWNISTIIDPADWVVILPYLKKSDFKTVLDYVRGTIVWSKFIKPDSDKLQYELLKLGLMSLTAIATTYYFWGKEVETAVESAIGDPITERTKNSKSVLEQTLDLQTVQGDRNGLSEESLSAWQQNSYIHTYKNANGTVPGYVTTSAEVTVDYRNKGTLIRGERAKFTYANGNVLISRHLFDKMHTINADEMLINVYYAGQLQFTYSYRDNDICNQFIKRFDKKCIDMVYFPANIRMKPPTVQFDYVPMQGDVLMIHTQEKGTIVCKQEEMMVNGKLVKFDHPTYILKIKGQLGFSGSPVYLISRQRECYPTVVGVIGGFRAGDQYIIFQPIPQLNYTPHAMINSSDVRFFYDHMYDLKLDDKIHKNSILTHVPDLRTGEYVGSLKKRVTKQKTQLHKTEFTDIVETMMPELKNLKPAPLHARMRGNVWVNDKLGKLKVQNTAKLITQQKPLYDAVDIIVKHYLSLMDLTKLEPYTLDQAIRGIPGVFNPINRATSCGPFIPRLKEDYIEGNIDDYTFNADILDKVRKAIDFIDEYGFYVITTDMSLKDELTKMTKIDTGLCRGFNGTDLVSVLILRMYLGPFYTEMMRIRKQSFAQVGINATGKEFKEMIDHMCESMKRAFDDKAFMDGDYKYFDNLLNVLYYSMKVIYDVMKEAPYYKDIKNRKHLIRLRVVVSAQIRTVQIIDCDVIIMDASMPSGTVGTAYINCISEGLYEVVIYCVCESIDEEDVTMDFVVTSNERKPFFDNLALKNFGDDNHKMMSHLAESFYVHDNIMYGAKFLGVEITPAQKDKTQLEPMYIHETSFLKRTPYDHPELGYVGKLEETSIAKSLYYTDSTSEYWKEQVIPVAFREFALHGRATFDKWKTALNYQLEYDAVIDNILSKPLWYTDTIPNNCDGEYIFSSEYITDDGNKDKTMLTDFLKYVAEVGPVDIWGSIRILKYDPMFVPAIDLDPGVYITSNKHAADVVWQENRLGIQKRRSGPVIYKGTMHIAYYGLSNGLRAKIISFDDIADTACVLRVYAPIKPTQPQPAPKIHDKKYDITTTEGDVTLVSFNDIKQRLIDINIKQIRALQKIKTLAQEEVSICNTVTDAMTLNRINERRADLKRLRDEIDNNFVFLEDNSRRRARFLDLESKVQVRMSVDGIQSLSKMNPPQPPPEPTEQKRA